MTFAIALAWKLALVLLLFSVGEWCIHRYLLHGKWLFNNLSPLDYIFRDHAIDHHRHGMNQIRPHVDLSPLDYWPAYPIFGWHAWRYFALGQIGGLSSMIALGAVCCGHYVLWNALHREIHGLTVGGWITKLPGYQSFARHHRQHHLRPSKNFGVVFIWVDRLFRTKYKAA